MKKKLNGCEIFHSVVNSVSNSNLIELFLVQIIIRKRVMVAQVLTIGNL